MDKVFFVDEFMHINCSYEELLEYINNTNNFTTCYKNSNLKEYLQNLIVGLVTGNNLILIDSDMSKEEIEKLSINKEDFESKNIKLQCKSIFEVIEKIKTSKSQVTLFTSGTTGIPKKVVHSIESLTRNIKIGNKYANNIWAYCYNPTHMAGLQVFFQAFFNQNTIIYLFTQSREQIFNQLEKYRITNISATPTFYRLLMPFEKEFQFIKKVTFGGEKTDEKLIGKMKQYFPNAAFYNVYASTEIGSLLSSNGEFFSIPKHLEDKIRIIEHELQIHNSLLASYLDEKDTWYSTGDLVQINSENPLLFKFNGRKAEIINSGGYKINPKEVEDIIMQLSEIKYVKVYPKKNSVLGNIVCADILLDSNLDLTEEQIRNFLKTKLQEYKIPRIYKFIDAIEMTNNGKQK